MTSVERAMRIPPVIRIRRLGTHMPQPERVLDPTASPAAWYGHEIRTRRKEKGFRTAGAFAAQVQVSVDVVLKIERGE